MKLVVAYFYVLIIYFGNTPMLHTFVRTIQATIIVLVVVRVHAELGNDKSADHAEDDIITRFRDVLNGKSLNEVSRILKEIELSVIAAKKGQSVVLYIYCRTVKELMDLYEICLSGKLRDAVERLFMQSTASLLYVCRVCGGDGREP